MAGAQIKLLRLFWCVIIWRLPLQAKGILWGHSGVELAQGRLVSNGATPSSFFFLHLPRPHPLWVGRWLSVTPGDWPPSLLGVSPAADASVNSPAELQLSQLPSHTRWNYGDYASGARLFRLNWFTEWLLFVWEKMFVSKLKGQDVEISWTEFLWHSTRRSCIFMVLIGPTTRKGHSTNLAQKWVMISPVFVPVCVHGHGTFDQETCSQWNSWRNPYFTTLYNLFGLNIQTFRGLSVDQALRELFWSTHI